MPNFSMNAPNLSEATITIQERRYQYYQLRNFLGNFVCSKKIRLHVTDTAVCIFSEEMRKECSPPLPRLKNLEVETDTFTTAVTHSALMDSMRWMAPSLEFPSINRNSLHLLNYSTVCTLVICTWHGIIIPIFRVSCLPISFCMLLPMLVMHVFY